jgi:hypothetical protein
VTVRDADGRAIDEAQISVDGGMSQHGHGLPTRFRVTRNLGDGILRDRRRALQHARLVGVQARDRGAPAVGTPSREPHSRRASAPPRGAACRSPAWRDHRFSSGMAGKTVSGRRHSVPSRVRLSKAAHARSTRI